MDFNAFAASFGLLLVASRMFSHQHSGGGKKGEKVVGNPRLP
jgi:hypothetical protein